MIVHRHQADQTLRDPFGGQIDRVQAQSFVPQMNPGVTDLTVNKDGGSRVVSRWRAFSGTREPYSDPPPEATRRSGPTTVLLKVE